jgi:hypothetical protein
VRPFRVATPIPELGVAVLQKGGYFVPASSPTLSLLFLPDDPGRMAESA